MTRLALVQRTLISISLIVLVCNSLHSLAEQTRVEGVADVENMSCSSLEWERGRPFDYYSAETRRDTGGRRNTSLLYYVDSYHFNSNVRMLKRGQTSPLPGDLIYMLTTIPNHPVALETYSRFERRWVESETFRSSSQTRRPTHSADCFFQKAVSLFPQHGETWMVWGIHAHRSGQPKRALEYYQRALDLNFNIPELHYNRGLSQFAIGDRDGARVSAEQADAMGYPLKGLQNLLRGK